MPELADETQRVARFALVGVANTAVALISYGALIAIDVGYVVAGPIAWTLGVLNGYFWNRIWTFERAAHRASLLAKYVAVGVLGLGLNTALLLVLVDGIGLSQFPAEVVALPIVVMTTFVVNRFWVFGPHLEELASSVHRSAGPSSPR